MKIDLLISMDSQICEHVSPLIRSIAANCQQARVTVLQTGLNEARVSRLRKSWRTLLDVTIVECNPKITQRPVKCPLTSQAMFNRIFAIELLAEMKKALYLDIDTIVLQDLSVLFEQETGECGLAGVLDYFEPTLQEQLNDFYLSTPLEFPTAPKINAFNSGVLLMDFLKLREQRAFECMTHMLRERYMLDQPLLNLYSRGRFNVLDTKWNRSANYIGTAVPLADIGILHWHGKKPWNEPRPFQDIYDCYTFPPAPSPSMGAPR